MGIVLIRPLILTAIGAAIVLLALILGVLTLTGDDETPPQPPPAAEGPASSEAPAGSAAAGPDSRAEAVPPGFDVVRIDPEGNTVMAGRAAPNSRVTIRDGDRVLGEVEADGRGEWVFLPEEPLPPGSRELTLHAVDADGKTAESSDVVVLVVPEGGSGKTLALRTGREGGQSRLLQGAAPIEGEGSLSVDTVDYDAAGHLAVGGRGDAGGIVQLYLDNAFLGRAVIGDEGFWSITPEAPAPLGNHTLRADLVDAAGKVLARVEQPFSRAETAGLPEGVRVVIQPGNNLWRLARQVYGKGTAYTVIYDANKGLIVNPDLIYPGQVFIVPESHP
jgi:nucleoid-associated protein YgaU